MRQLKFRVFTVDEGMLYSNVDCFISINSNGSINNSGHPEHHVMQFTGLKDKNNKEIYEGDIVNGGAYNGSYRRGEIIFKKGRFYSIPTGKFAEGYSEDWCSFEVIGNIHETPELI